MQCHGARGVVSARSIEEPKPFRRSVAARVVFIVLAGALAVTGCGSSDSETTSKAPTTLTIATNLFPPSLDPSGGENAYGDYFNPAYDPLIVGASDGTYKPGLATSWKYGPRNMTFSLTLRENVKFSDGEPLDAAAVKTWIEYAMKSPGGRAKGYLASLKSIDVTGPLDLTLRFSQPTPMLELIFSQIFTIGQVGSPKAIKAKTLDTQTAGAGPYILDKASTVPRDHYTYVPNPLYWNKDAVHWKKVVIKTITNPSATLQALKTGQVQVATTQPVTSVDAAKKAGLEYVAPSALLMGMSLVDRDGDLLKPLGDVRVRQAINYAIDRKAVGAVLGAGYEAVTSQMAVKGDDSFDPELETRYPYDPAKAKELLAQAGYPDGFTLPLVSVNVVGQDKVAELVTGQLAKVGIKVKPDIKTVAGDYGTDLAGAKYPAATISWGRLPAYMHYKLLWGPDATAANPFKSRSPELDKLYKELIAAPTDQAGEYARGMQRFLVENAWFAPIAATPSVVLYRPEIAGVLGTPERIGTYNVEYRPAG